MKKVKLWEVAIIAAILVFLFFLFWPIHPGNKQGAIRTACLSNLKQIGFAQLAYLGDYDDHFPDRDVWMDSVLPYIKEEKQFRCTALYKEANPQLYGYAFNANLSKAKFPAKGPEAVPLVFESLNLARNASDPFISLPKPGRHEGRNNVGYADGHAKILLPK